MEDLNPPQQNAGLYQLLDLDHDRAREGSGRC
jgi:hypothetical protein